MVDVKGDGDDGLSGLVDTVGLEKEDLELTVIVNGNNIGGVVLGESEENNGGDLVVGEEGGKGKEVVEELVVEEERVEEGKDGEDVVMEEKRSEENGVVGVEKEGGLETEADINGAEGIEKKEGGKIEAANDGVEGLEKEGGKIEAANDGVEGIEKEGGKIEAANDGAEGIEKKEGDKIEVADNGKGTENSQKKVDENSTPKGRKPKKRIRKKKVVQGVSKVVIKDEDKPESSAQKKVVKMVVSKNEDKPESSSKKKVVKTVVSKTEDKPESSKRKKNSKKVESMGMIFMCTSQTKKDCYRYKLLGLPAGKKELVEKIYKGMRLFLFDLDLRLLYGIYKAAAPGGTNIEPKAFKSAFPSQVRFTVLEDCLPLAEEKFKDAIKENYYSRNKFDCQLNSEQVKKLCKLFVSVNKGSALPKISKSLVVGRTSEGLKQQSREEKRGRKRRDRDEGSRKQLDRDEERGRKRRGRREERKSPPRREQRQHERPVIYANEVSYSQVAPLHGGYQLPAPVYTYERTLEIPYRHERVLEHRGLPVVDREPRHRDETKTIDPYISYREREAPSLRRPVYSSASEREYYSPAVMPAAYLPAGRESERHATSGLRDYYQPGTLPSEYLPPRREIEYIPSRREVEYRTTAELPAEYHSTRPLREEYHASRSLLAEYRAAGLPTEDLAPAGLSNGYHRAGPATEYRSSAGGLRDYRSLQTAPRYR